MRNQVVVLARAWLLLRRRLVLSPGPPRFHRGRSYRPNLGDPRGAAATSGCGAWVETQVPLPAGACRSLLDHSTPTASQSNRDEPWWDLRSKVGVFGARAAARGQPGALPRFRSRVFR